MKKGIGLENANALLTHGDGQVIDSELSNEFLTGLQQSVKIAPGNSCDQPKLLKIRADRGSAGIFAKVPAFGVDQYRDSTLAGPGR